MIEGQLAIIYLLPILVILLIVWGATKIAQRRSERAVKRVLWAVLTAMLATWFPCLMGFKIFMVKQATERDSCVDELISLSVNNLASGRSQVVHEAFNRYLDSIERRDVHLGPMNHDYAIYSLIQSLRDSTNHASQAGCGYGDARPSPSKSMGMH